MRRARGLYEQFCPLWLRCGSQGGLPQKGQTLYQKHIRKVGRKEITLVEFMSWRLSRSLVHPSAIVHQAARLGTNVRVGPYCVVDKNVVLGDGVCLDTQVIS